MYLVKLLKNLCPAISNNKIIGSEMCKFFFETEKLEKTLQHQHKLQVFLCYLK